MIIRFLILIVAFTVSTVKAQQQPEPNKGKEVFGISSGINQDAYFKEYLRIAGRSKEDKKFAKFYNRKVIVVLQEHDEQKLKYYKSSPTKTSLYKSLVDQTNELFVKLIPSYWNKATLSSSGDTILFKKYSECLLLSKSPSASEYVTIEFSSLRESSNENLYALADKSGVDIRRALINKPGEHGTMDVKLLEEFERPAFYSFFTITSYPNELDFIIALQQISYFFKERALFFGQRSLYEKESMERREELKSKIVLVDSVEIEKRNGFSYIDEKFPSSYGFTNGEGLLQIIKDKDTAYAYVVVVPFLPVLGDKSFEYTSGGQQEDKDVLSYYHLLISSQNGEILAYLRNESRIINKRSWSRYADIYELDTSTFK